MARLKKFLKAFIYPIIFVVFLVSGIYWGFPLDSVKDFVALEFKKNLAKASEGKFDFEPEVTIGHMAPWYLTGVEMDDVEILMPTEDGRPAKIQLEAVKLRLGLLKTLSGTPSFEFDTELYGSNIYGHAALRQDGLDSFSLNIRGLELAQAKALEKNLGVKVAGKIDFSAEMQFAKSKKEMPVGSVKLNTVGFKVGPGKLNLPGAGFSSGLDLPEFKIGQISGNLSIKDGLADLPDFSIKGGDVLASLKVSSELKSNLAFSKLSGSGFFKLKETFLQANPKFSTIFELSPEIKRAQDAEGRVHLEIKGSLVKPRMKLSPQ